MKKTILLFAASLATLSLNASGFDDNLTVSIGNKTITEGAVVKVSEYEDFESIVPGMGYNYVANIVIRNNTDEVIPTGIKISYTDHPTEAMATADPAAWGGLQLCVFNAAEGDNCLPVLEMEKSVKANSTMTWQFDNTGVSPANAEKDRKYNVLLTAEGTSLSFDVIFDPSDEPVENPNAGFNGNLTVTIGDETITEGAVVKVSEYEDFESIVPGMGYNYLANIVIRNNTDEVIPTGIKISYTDHPTEAMAAADPAAWGGLQLCVFNAAEGDNCLPVLKMEKSVKANSTMTWQFDNTGVRPANAEKDRKYNVLLTAEGTSLSFDVIFDPSDVPVENPDAGFNGNLTVTIGDETITEGAVVKVSEYEDWEQYVPGMGYNYVADIVIRNNTDEVIPTGIKISYTDHPTEAMAAADPAAWGGLQVCVSNAAEGDSCLPVLEMEKSVKANSTMTWQFDNTGVSPANAEKDRKYNVLLTAEGTSLSFDVIFDPNVISYIESVEADGVAEYFNLQGQRVEYPAKGLYIVKQNGKTKKIFVR